MNLVQAGNLTFSKRVQDSMSMWWLALLLIGCQSSSYEDFREKGQSKTRSLIADLKSIRTKDQLIERRDKLERHFMELEELMRQVAHYRQKSEEKIAPYSAADSELSDRLRMEILRIYRMEGGKETIDACRRIE